LFGSNPKRLNTFDDFTFSIISKYVVKYFTHKEEKIRDQSTPLLDPTFNSKGLGDITIRGILLPQHFGTKISPTP
jgi:hypothetical protein